MSKSNNKKEDEYTSVETKQEFPKIIENGKERLPNTYKLLDMRQNESFQDTEPNNDLHKIINELYPEPISFQELSFCVDNLVHFFEKLIEIDKELKEKELKYANI